MIQSVALTLVILAAGRGTRFGGDKPMAAAGPNGECLFEYSIYDAVNAGFRRVVFVVNPEQNTDEFSERLHHYGKKLSVEFVVQTQQTGPGIEPCEITERVKPWGTGHALLACQKIATPFVVINCDDYYGASNFRLVGNWLLHNSHNPLAAAMPGYILKNTLTRTGGVNRGVCRVSADGFLESIYEVTGISVNTRSSFYASEEAIVTKDSLVSMTFWGFQPHFFSILDSAFTRFIERSADLVTDEFYLPEAVDFAIRAGILEVKVFPTVEQWFGITYADDLEDVRNSISSKIHAGLYPAQLIS